MEPLFLTIDFFDLVIDEHLSVVDGIKDYIVAMQFGNVLSIMSPRQE